MFQMMGVFAEFERSMIRERVLAGMSRAAASGTRSGKPIGRPRIEPETEVSIRAALAKGDIGMRKIAVHWCVLREAGPQWRTRRPLRRLELSSAGSRPVPSAK